MRATFYLLSFVLVLLTASCRKAQQADVEPSADLVIRINPDSLPAEVVPFSQVFERIDYLPIPTDSDFLIGTVNKLLVTEEYIFIVDSDISHSAFCIDHSGRKVLRLSHRGAGPEEYIEISDLAYNPENGEIALLDRINQKLIYYNMAGQLLRERKTPYNIERLQPAGKNFAMYCNYEANKKLRNRDLQPNILLADPEDNIIAQASYFHYPVNHSVVLNTNCQFSQFGDTLSIKPDHSGIVYHLSENTLRPAWHLDFGKYNEDSRYWKKTREANVTYSDVETYVNEQHICTSMSYFENETYLTFYYWQSGTAYAVIYSKNTRKIIHTSFLFDDFDKLNLFQPLTIRGRQFFCILEPEKIYRFKEEAAVLNPFLNSIERFDNPIIAILTIKPF
jgi:hypothetical protein